MYRRGYYRRIDTYDIMVKGQASNTANLLDFINKNPPKIHSQLRSIIKRHKKVIDSDLVLRDKIVELIDQETKKVLKLLRWQNGSDCITRIIKHYSDYITDDIRQQIIALTITPMKNYYTPAKRKLVELVSGWIDSDKAVEIFKLHHRVINKSTMDVLLTKIPEDKRDTKIQKILKEPAKIIETVVSEDLNDLEKRKKIIRILAKYKTLMRKIPFTVQITTNDLAQLAPKTRFKLLKNAIDNLYRCSDDCNSKWFKIYMSRQKVIIKALSDQDINTLLFSVSLVNNEEVKKWVDQYKEFRDNVLKKVKSAEDDIALLKQWAS